MFVYNLIRSSLIPLRPDILMTLLISTLIGIIICIYGLKAIRLYQNQSAQVYHPRKHLDATPAERNIDYADVHFRTSDNILLHGWFAPCTDKQKVILLLHGNTGNISDCISSIPLFASLGYSTFVFDYRGYGQSEGAIDEQGTYKDAEAAWQWLLHERHYTPQNIVILGRSLGAAIGSHLASQHPSAAVVLESTFTSLPDIAAETHRFIPARLMTRFNYNTLANIRKIRSPILIVHGVEDNVIPYHHGRQLFNAANEPKDFLNIEADHAEGFLHSGKDYINGLKSFLEKHVAIN